MTLSLHDVIRSYLGYSLRLSSVWDWLADYQWDLQGEERTLADSVEEAIVQFHDGYLDEADVRSWLSHLIHRQTTVTIDASLVFFPMPRLRQALKYRTSQHASSSVAELAIA